MMFSVRVWLASVGILTVVFLAADGKRCTRVLNRVPVHRRFNQNRFLGTWYSIKQATDSKPENDVIFESSSMAFSKNKDGSLSYSVTGKVGDDPCLPVETGSMRRRKRPGHYVMEGTSLTQDDPTFIVSFTDYKTALVYYCLKYNKNRLGQCAKGGLHVEILSRSAKPKKAQIASFVKRMIKRLCVLPKWIRTPTPGQCKIPDILDQAKLDKIEHNLDSEDSSKCAVNNIPVQKEFSLAEMDGVWFEIARTRFTFNQMESVISAHKYVTATDEIYSYYTGTINGTCLTAIQGMSKSRSDEAPESDMLGRIGGPESTYPWAPMKVLYADPDYLLFYACYSGASDSPCIKQAVEVTLVGRSRDIEKRLQKQIYKILKDVCIEPDDMKATKVEANCSEWVEVEIRNVGLNPGDCPIDGMVNRTEFDLFDVDQIVGEWQGYAGKDFGPEGTALGLIVNITQDPNNAFTMNRVGFVDTSNTSNCSSLQSNHWQERCMFSGNFISALPDGQWAFGAVLYQDESTLVLYECRDRNIQGTCEPSGISAYVLTRNQSMTEESMEEVEVALRGACINPDDLIKMTDRCDNSLLPEAVADQVDADPWYMYIDSILLFSEWDNYDQERLQGYWYSIGYLTDDEASNAAAGIVYITSDDDDVLQTYATEITDRETGSCTPVEHRFAIPRCPDTVNGDYLARVDVTGNLSRSFSSYKILYTDYDDILVTYECDDVQEDGTCAVGHAVVHILGRNTTLSDYAMDYVHEWIPYESIESDVIYHTANANSCRAELEAYVSENELEFDGETEEADDDEEEEEEEEEASEEFEEEEEETA